MRFSDSFIQEVSERNDIVDVVSGYVSLTKRSGANMFGLCPFHSEKTPSFSVNPGRQMYHCFGCGKGGGVINFMMEIENLTFPEAVETLAKRVNMPLPAEEQSAEGKKRARMLALNKEAARFFYNQLKTDAGKPALRYMESRNVEAQPVKKFGLGYAPDTWDSLRNAMKELGVNHFEMHDAGLVKKGRNGGFYDAFRNRLMFPIFDAKGNVIGFSGRILGDGEPKYLNSPETLVFNKSRNLFGLNLAKRSKAGYIILVEGNVDVFALHQAGFDSAVASLGTSLTSEQARVLSNYTKEIIIAYDNDSAGQKAAQRAIKILEQLDLVVRVLQMEGAKDPDEFLKIKGKDAFQNLLDRSEGQIDYRMKKIMEQYDLNEPDQKVAFLNDATDMLSDLPNRMASEVYAGRLASETGISKDVLMNEVEQKRKRKQRSFRRREENNMHPERNAQPAKREFRYEDVRSAKAEEGILRLIARDSSVLTYPLQPAGEEFSSAELRTIFEAMKSIAAEGRDITTASLSGTLSPDQMSLLSSIDNKPESMQNLQKAWNDYTNIIKEQYEIRSSGEDLLALRERIKKKGDK